MNEAGRQISPDMVSLPNSALNYSVTGRDRIALRDNARRRGGIDFMRKAARMTRAAQNSSWLQVEDEENDPDWLPDEAVVS